MRVILYMTITANGYIARENGDTPWSAEEFQAYYDFVKERGNVVVGRKTYELMQGSREFEKAGSPEVIVVSKQGAEFLGATAVSSPEEAVHALQEKGFEEIVVGGGGMLNASFLEAGLLDEIILDVEPRVFGKGIHLFEPHDAEAELELIKMEKLSPNTLRLHYRIRKKEGMPTREEKLVAIAKPYFESCRVGDWDHAQRVARWMRELAGSRKDKELLIAAAYLHDVGWYGVAPRGKLDFGEMLKLEEAANRNTKPLIEKIMRLAGYGKNNIDTVTRLAEAADKHESKSDDEAILVDADNLSKLSPQHLEEKYEKESWKEIIESWEKEFPAQIKTLRARELYPAMLADLKRKYLHA